MLGKRRRGELEYLQKNAAGAYVYTGDWYAWENPRGRALGALWALYGLGTLSMLGAGLLPAPGLTGAFYVVLPYVAALVTAISALWSLGQLTAAGDPIRVYVWETACQRLPRRGLASAILAAGTLLGEGVYLLLHGAEDRGGAAAGFLGLMALGCLCQLLGRRTIRSLEWKKQ